MARALPISLALALLACGGADDPPPVSPANGPQNGYSNGQANGPVNGNLPPSNGQPHTYGTGYSSIPEQPPPLGQPGPFAPACGSDSQCGSHRCNKQVGRCVLPCSTDWDCNNGFQCLGKGTPAAICVIKP